MFESATITMSLKEFEDFKNKPKQDVTTIALRVARKVEQEFGKEIATKLIDTIQKELDDYYA